MFRACCAFLTFVTLFIASGLPAMAQSGLTTFKIENRKKVIFDCDLGDDIDDAYALALLCASPGLVVLGIIAVGMVLWPDLFKTQPPILL